MKSSLLKIENLFYEKIFLYRELLDTLKIESKYLTNTKVDDLWHISDKKQSLAKSIGAIRGKILEALDEALISHKMDISSFKSSKILTLLPKELSNKLSKVNVSLITIKEEVHSLAKANKEYVEEYLAVLDELINIIANASKPKPNTYINHKFINNNRNANLLLNMEV